ncbi:MAG TPA: tRNA uridine(34) 5-carboxymethylaminomethyl modification radical SAM/GNAT enzyme Elp3, partial [Candidatus Dojkabacteria bacterium]|nr:tRNA uridine(34) 5-carboxymethylaminomethyl modification radical SAM/GNAT enzyme Elp3 [Candidatus Dojkabacteria bacterium]
KQKKGYKSKKLEERIRMKPTRTNSGVAVVTVLTKPYPCPGNCIYCPNEENMPKSYIASEPGAQRALSNKFDPYAQVFNRLIALKNVGHNIEKVELIILGGTWSYYDKDYQLSFIYDCFRALNDVKKNSNDYVQPREGELDKVTWEEIQEVHKKNELAYCRNVGLVLETRPDYITKEELIRMRRLGATKVQIGIQSLSNEILKKNNIGRKNEATKEAFKLLRRMGFKIHGHWMPNLYGSTVKKDIKDYKKLWTKEYSPDELKIYPTSIIKNTHLNYLYQQGLYEPYTDRELTDLLKTILPLTPRYCRLTRVVRDIPSGEIVAGNRKTNLRQLVQQEMDKENIKVEDIRSREIRDKKVTEDMLETEEIKYDTTVSKEYFISYKTKDEDKICGFLRLSLPKGRYKNKHFLDELEGCAIIREVHVYGKVLGLGKNSNGESQHLGLGKSLIKEAEKISKKNGFKKISVISAIGTREYYKKRGFENKNLYMHKKL